MSITTALSARRDALRDREAGFTLIELLVVVLIIGILAAIAIPVYLGVQNGAKESATKSDLVNAKTAITAYAATYNGVNPTSVANTAAGAVPANTAAGAPALNLSTDGWSLSNNTTSLIYKLGTASPNVGAWCVIGTSATGKAFVISTNTSVATGSTCPATY
jgi:type IV pilus assembly protein PilA